MTFCTVSEVVGFFVLLVEFLEAVHSVFLMAASFINNFTLMFSFHDITRKPHSHCLSEKVVNKLFTFLCQPYYQRKKEGFFFITERTDL